MASVGEAHLSAMGASLCSAGSARLPRGAREEACGEAPQASSRAAPAEAEESQVGGGGGLLMSVCVCVRCVAACCRGSRVKVRESKFS